MFCDRMDVEKPQKVPPFSFSASWDFFPKIFFSSKGPPFNFFDILQQFGCLKSQRVSLSVFRHCEIFFETLFFLRRVPPSTATHVPPHNCDNFRRVSLLARQGLALAGPARHSVHIFEHVIFSKKKLIFEYCKREYLTLGSLFAFFEPWIWRRLGPVPVCSLLYLIVLNSVCKEFQLLTQV